MRCIGSVRAQACQGVIIHHHVQDGGSTDRSMKALQSYARSCSAKRCGFSYASGRDDGMYDAINRAWQRSADADVVSWLNADEQYLPGALVRVKHYFETHPEADVVFGNMIIVNQEGIPLAARREVPFRPWYIKHDFLYTASCTLFFRRHLREAGILQFDMSYRLAGDMDLMLRLAVAGAMVGHINEYQSLFEAHPGALSARRHVEMQNEVRRIRQARGSNHPIPRSIAKACRMIERATRGCYRRKDIDLLYAENEIPTYRSLRARRLGGRFTYERFNMTAAQHD
jgi:glycosyltransferase involved in cell wall biosynthesis